VESSLNLQHLIRSMHFRDYSDYKRAGVAEELIMRVACVGSPESVFAAWTDGRRLKQWLGGGDYKIVPAFRTLRQGGKWSVHAESLRRRRRSWFGGVVHVQEPPNRLRFCIANEDLVEIAAPTMVTVTFKCGSDRTLVEVRHQGFHSEGERRAYRAIWSNALQALQECMAKKPANDPTLVKLVRAFWKAATGRCPGDDRALG
jgi:uncharacterized protein YndB with AHSA1/START domain